MPYEVPSGIELPWRVCLLSSPFDELVVYPRVPEKRVQIWKYFLINTGSLNFTETVTILPYVQRAKVYPLEYSTIRLSGRYYTVFLQSNWIEAVNEERLGLCECVQQKQNSTGRNQNNRSWVRCAVSIASVNGRVQEPSGKTHTYVRTRKNYALYLYLCSTSSTGWDQPEICKTAISQNFTQLLYCIVLFDTAVGKGWRTLFIRALRKGCQ